MNTYQAYQTLQVDSDASFDDIKYAYRKLALELHPDKNIQDKDDKKLQRLIAFRLKVDGEIHTGEYLIRKIRETIECGYAGNLYDFLKDDFQEKECGLNAENRDPPEVA